MANLPRAAAATVALPEETAKLTLEQRLKVLTVNQDRAIMETKCYLCLTGKWFT